MPHSSVDVYKGLVLVCGVESSVRPPLSQGTIGGMLFKTVQSWKYFALFRGGQPPAPPPRPAWHRLWGISQLSSDFIHQSSLNCAPDKFNFSHFSKLSLTTFINFIMFLQIATDISTSNCNEKRGILHTTNSDCEVEINMKTFDKWPSCCGNMLQL